MGCVEGGGVVVWEGDAEVEGLHFSVFWKGRERMGGRGEGKGGYLNCDGVLDAGGKFGMVRGGAVRFGRIGEGAGFVGVLGLQLTGRLS